MNGDDGKHEEYDFTVKGQDGTMFKVFARQNVILRDDFSCGLRWDAPSGEAIILARYNGSSHPHTNRIEKTRFVSKHHIHRATERYVQAGLPAEGYAMETTAYASLAAAVTSLARDCHIEGLALPPQQLGLISGGVH